MKQVCPVTPSLPVHFLTFIELVYSFVFGPTLILRTLASSLSCFTAFWARTRLLLLALLFDISFKGLFGINSDWKRVRLWSWTTPQRLSGQHNFSFNIRQKNHTRSAEHVMGSDLKRFLHPSRTTCEQKKKIIFVKTAWPGFSRSFSFLQQFALVPL